MFFFPPSVVLSVNVDFTLFIDRFFFLEAHTGEIVGGIAGGILLVVLGVSLTLYRNWKYEQELDSLLWKVNYKDIEIKEAKEESAVSPSEQIFKNNNSKVVIFP